MRKFLPLFIFLSILLSFQVEERLSIVELKEEAELFILNQSYIDAISNYEKIYDMQSLIFGIENKNLSETLIVLGDLYYKIDDEINALRCFQEAIHIMHYNSLLSNQKLMIPLEYLYEIYLNNEQLELSETISAQLESLYLLDTLSYDNTNWLNVFIDYTNNSSIQDSIIFYSDSTIALTPYDYIDSAKYYIENKDFSNSINMLSNAFIEGYDLFDYTFYDNLFQEFNNEELHVLRDFFQRLKYANNQDIQVSTYFYLSIISYQLGNNQLSQSYIKEFLILMPDDMLGFIILGNNLYNQKKYIDAIAEYQKVLWIEPDSEITLFQQAICFYELGYYDAATQNFNSILHFNPDHYNSIYYLALINYKNNNFELAVSLFTDLLMYDSKNYKIYNYLGDAYYKLDNLKKSLLAFKQSIALNPYDGNIYYQLGLIYEKLLKPDQAIKNYEQAFNMGYNEPELFYRLGVIFYEYHELKKALPYLRTYILSNPQDIFILEKLGLILYQLNRFPEAVDIYKRLLNIDNQNIQYFEKIAKIYWDLENYNKARQYYEIILDMKQSNGQIFYNLGFIANKNGEYELAKNYLFNAIECDYLTKDLYLQLSYAHIESKDFVDLIPILYDGLHIDPNNQNLLYDLGVSYYKIGFYKQAIKILEQYFPKHQEDLTVAYYLGISYYHNKNYQKGSYYLNIVNNNSDYEILFYLGLCAYQLEEYNKSIILYKKSLIINPNNQYAIYSLGQCYIYIGDKKNAKRQLKTLMNTDISLFELLKISFDIKFDR